MLYSSPFQGYNGPPLPFTFIQKPYTQSEVKIYTLKRTRPACTYIYSIYIDLITYIFYIFCKALKACMFCKLQNLFQAINRYYLVKISILHHAERFGNATVTISLFTRGSVYKIRCKHSSDHPIKNIVRPSQALHRSRPLCFLNFR